MTSTPTGSGSITRTASFTRGEAAAAAAKDLKRDTSKSTAEGEWEMREGKWYRKDYFSLEKAAPKEVVKVACQMCPTHISKITILTQERDRLQGFLVERDRLIVEMRTRIEYWENEQRTWMSDRRLMETRIGELEGWVSERDRTILEMRTRLERWEMEQRQWMSDRRLMEQRIAELEALVAERRDWFSPQMMQEKERIIISLNERITILISEKETFMARLLKMEEKLAFWESEAKTWMADRQLMEQHIAELEAMMRDRKDWVSSTFIKEKETIIINLNERIEALLRENEEQAARIRQMQETIDTYERQFAICKGRGMLCNNKDTPVAKSEPAPIIHDNWYYAVQDPSFANMFSHDPSYKGGQIVIDALDGATVVNPEYYSQSETVPGMSRLRVRVVDFVAMGLPNFAGSELFVRLKLGEATQFTQARPVQYAGVSWNQDMVFVEVPVQSHSTDSSANCSVYPLIIEVVSRTIGTVAEAVVGTATLDISDLVRGLTRTNLVQLSAGGAVNLRIKALDFGLTGRCVQRAGFSGQAILQAPSYISQVPTFVSQAPSYISQQYIQPVMPPVVQYTQPIVQYTQPIMESAVYATTSTIQPHMQWEQALPQYTHTMAMQPTFQTMMVQQPTLQTMVQCAQPIVQSSQHCTQTVAQCSKPAETACAASCVAETCEPTIVTESHTTRTTTTMEYSEYPSAIVPQP